jgi:internalin A
MSFEVVETPLGTDLVVTGDWSSAASRQIDAGVADGLVLNYALGFRERDLEFVRGLPIRRLKILARTHRDLSPVYSLADTLTWLSVQSHPSAQIECERLPRLSHLSADWSQVQGSIRFLPYLQQLFLGHYSERDLSALGMLESLTSIVMKDYPQLRSLDGLELFPSLAELGIHLAKNLEDIEALRRSSSPLLKTVQLPACRKITDISAVSGCTSLRAFELSDGSEVPTVEPLSVLVGLEHLTLFGSTAVADGDLTPIAELPRLTDFRMMNRRHYSPSVPEIQSVIDRRVRDAGR